MQPRSLVVRVGLVGVTALVAAGLLGTAAGVATYTTMRPPPAEDRGWDELGAAVFALGAGAVVGGIVYVAAVVAGVRRVAPRGRRARSALVLLAGPVALFALAAGVEAIQAEWHARRETEARLREEAVPVALVDGDTLDAPIPGWRVVSVSANEFVDAPRVRYQAGDRTWTVSFHGGTTTPVCPSAGACSVIGHLGGGERVWGWQRVGQEPSGGYDRVWVAVDSGWWEIEGDDFPQPISGRVAVRVLDRFEPVSVERFLDVARRA